MEGEAPMHGSQSTPPSANIGDEAKHKEYKRNQPFDWNNFWDLVIKYLAIPGFLFALGTKLIDYMLLTQGRLTQLETQMEIVMKMCKLK